MTIELPALFTQSGTPVWIEGAGATIILIHGVLADHRMWSRQVEALAPYYRICSYDMWGHGEAPDPPGERSLSDFVDQLDEVLAHCAEGLAPVVVGFSMGGLVAQAYAAQFHHKLRGLALLNAVHDRSPEQAKRVWQRYQGNMP